MYKRKKDGSYLFRVRIANTHYGCLEKLQNQYGGNIYTDLINIKGAKHYCYKHDICAIEEVKTILRDVKKYMIIRKDQAELMYSCINGKVDKDEALYLLKKMKKDHLIENGEREGTFDIDVSWQMLYKDLSLPRLSDVNS